LAKKNIPIKLHHVEFACLCGEVPVVEQGRKVASATQQQRLLDRALDRSLTSFDRAVLVADAQPAAASAFAGAARGTVTPLASTNARASSA
jgi:hypothetical protein